jgi:hypothetical protein
MFIAVFLPLQQHTPHPFAVVVGRRRRQCVSPRTFRGGCGGGNVCSYWRYSGEVRAISTRLRRQRRGIVSRVRCARWIRRRMRRTRRIRSWRSRRGHIMCRWTTTEHCPFIVSNFSLTVSMPKNSQKINYLQGKRSPPDIPGLCDYGDRSTRRSVRFKKYRSMRWENIRMRRWPSGRLVRGVLGAVDANCRYRLDDAIKMKRKAGMKKGRSRVQRSDAGVSASAGTIQRLD